MMGVLWVVILVALTGSHFGSGSPLKPTSQDYPHDPNTPTSLEGWGPIGWYAIIASVGLVVTAVGLLLGCAWCYRHKDCKLFSASAIHLHDARQPTPEAAEPSNNNISEDNNNGPISLREMQNIANNNATAYIVSENEERNRVSRESVVEFEPLPRDIRVVDPLERCADWFGADDFPRNGLQYLREIGRGWFGRVVEGEIEEGRHSVAVKILNQNASLEQKARFLDEARLYRDVSHPNVLRFVGQCLTEDPWVLLFELCSMDLQQYLTTNRPRMATLTESGVPLQLMCDVSSALAHLHSRGLLYGNVSSSNVLVREEASSSSSASSPSSSVVAHAVLGSYAPSAPDDFVAPEARRHPPVYTSATEVWSLGSLIWEVCAWGAPLPVNTPPPPELPCLYRNHLYQVMQLCWDPTPSARPTAAQVNALIGHLQSTHSLAGPHDAHSDRAFEERWQRLKPNSIPKLDEHIAIVHAPSTSTHFTGSDHDINPHDTLSIDMDTAVSRSSSIISDNLLSVQIKSESLTNLHGSLDDVRNIYLTHNETAALECHQGNISYEENDRSDSSVDPWLKDVIIAGSQDDVSYYKDVSDVIKNLDNILNSEKTSSSESSHQASPSRDNLSLDCKKDYPVQSSLVKSPGITNFQNLLEAGLDAPKDTELAEDDEVDRDTIGTLSHSFERHSDTTSQHTLENLTPDTPVKDADFIFSIETQINAEHNDTNGIDENTELPKDKVRCSDSKLPNLKDLCVVSCSVSETNEQLNVSEDCVTSCDSKLEEIVRTDEMKTKSIDNIQEAEVKEIQCNSQEMIQEETMVKMVDEEQLDLVKETSGEIEVFDQIKEIAGHFVENEVIQPAINIVTKKLEKDKIEMLNFLENEVIQPAINIVTKKLEKEKNETLSTRLDSTNNASDVMLPPCDLIITVTENLEQIESYKNHTIPTETSEKIKDSCESGKDLDTPSASLPSAPEIVQIVEDSNIALDETNESESTHQENNASMLSSEKVQIERDHNAMKFEPMVENTFRSDSETALQQSNDSTVYMDLINDRKESNHSETLDHTLDKNFDVMQSCLEPTNTTIAYSIPNDSTAYMDLPSVLQETTNFLHSERLVSGDSMFKDKVCSSTPKGSENNSSENNVDGSDKVEDMSETKVADNCLEATVSKISQKLVAEHTMSPFDSPTKSHPTDTYDENSSVLLGPFENCATDVFKGLDLAKADTDLPKEEMLAFSSNFSDINLETPSPLRDGNFLNEVPDIVPEDVAYDDATISDVKTDSKTENTDESEQSATTKHVSPSTPPNSPGIYLASTSHQKYVVDIDFDAHEPQSYAPIESDSGLSSLQKEIDLNQIELQITSKLAMAENENNMNIEYSGPLTVEGVVSGDDMILMESEAVPDAFLAGNGGSIEDLRDGFTLDEDSMQALRNELELKLPLAQVAGIEPADEPSWSELPPPPELVVTYCAAPGALSPIQEETRHQLSAYENDAWNPSTRTDSSESYPEPCNNSTDEVTDLPTGPDGPNGPDDDEPTSHDHTFSIHSCHDTYTIQKDIPSSKELTMSADSLNGSPHKRPSETSSPANDKTYTKNDDNVERLSQVSPFLMSPTTDTSAPVDSENATRVSTISQTTAPTDAKPSDGLSKATTIDSWCSNDTLYNVEENFDDLADNDIAPTDKEDHSDSTDTLTHHDDEDASHCSTYIIHDTKSEENFSPDSITANDNYTYTKVKTETTGATPSIVTQSPTDTQTKDLAYGTMPSNSNCSTELAAVIDDPWKHVPTEQIRKSPLADENLTPPKPMDSKITVRVSPQIETEPSLSKMDSVEISCLQDDNRSDVPVDQGTYDSPKCNYSNNMIPTVTSTPLDVPLDENDEDVESISITFPDARSQSPEFKVPPHIPDFQTFFRSAEIRPQNSCNRSELEGSSQDTRLLLASSDQDNTGARHSPSYNDFETSAARAQGVQSRSSQSVESMSSGEFRQFENSVRDRPQDLSSLIDASSSLLNSERQSHEVYSDQIGNRTTNDSGNANTQQSDSITDVSNVDASATDRTPTYSDFESSAVNKPQDAHSKSSISETVMSSGDFRQFENSIRDRPQDLSSPTDVKLSIGHDNEAYACDRSINEISPNNPPNVTNMNESHLNYTAPITFLTANLDVEDENEQPHSIIITDVQLSVPKESSSRPYEITTLSSALMGHRNDASNKSNVTYDSHLELFNSTFDSHELNAEQARDKNNSIFNGIEEKTKEDSVSSLKVETEMTPNGQIKVESPNKLNGDVVHVDKAQTQCNGSENFAVVSFFNEPFEELESNAGESKHSSRENTEQSNTEISEKSQEANENIENGFVNGTSEQKVTSVTNDFLQNEKRFCQLDSYLPLLNDIRFTGPASEIMSTSFTQDSPTELNSPECEQDSKPNVVADIVKEWDSDSDSQSSNSSSGEFIWKDGEGRETPVVPSTHFDHLGGMQRGGAQNHGRADDGGATDASGSGDSASGSEGDEVEFVPSSWDCQAAPAKSSLRSLEQAPPDSKKRVVFKRQKYHCVYEYPREVADETVSPAYLPDFSTYCDWDPTSAEEAELGYGQLFGGPSPLDLYASPLRAGIAFGADYDEDFFISSSARPFESLGIMSTTSQFFPGKHFKPSLLERDLDDESFPPPPSPLATPAVPQLTQTPSLDFTTPDSGVEDITPGSTNEEDFKKKLPEEQCWRVDSNSSSESVSPSSPGGEALGGLRHTRDKLKLDLPPSPHIPSPRHQRVFNFVLDKPRRRPDRVPSPTQPQAPQTPLVMTDETPVVTTHLSLKEDEDIPVPEPTFSTFGKSVPRSSEQEQKIILDEVESTTKEEEKVVETVKGEGTVLDSGDEDSGIESSSKATLERKTNNVS